MNESLTVLMKESGFRKEAATAFAKGLVFVVIFFALLFGWMMLRADDTLARWQERFPSKTVSVAASAPQTAVPATGLGASDLFTPSETMSAPPASDKAQATYFNQFKKTVSLSPAHSYVAIVLTDLGIAEEFTKSLIESLPSGITLGFSPYADKLDLLKAGAQDKGFETWLMLPLEPASYPESDPGPLTVLSNASLETIQDHVGRLTALAATGYPGFISNKNHNFSEADLRTNPVMRMIAEQGFGFAEGRHQGNDFAKDFAAKNYIPYAQADEWLNRNMGRADIQAVLQRTEKLAQLNGRTVLMVEATPLSARLIEQWADKLPGRNIEIVPLSALAQ